MHAGRAAEDYSRMQLRGQVTLRAGDEQNLGSAAMNLDAELKLASYTRCWLHFDSCMSTSPKCVLTTSRCMSPLMSMASRLIHSHGSAGKVMSNCMHRRSRPAPGQTCWTWIEQTPISLQVRGCIAHGLPAALLWTDPLKARSRSLW